MIDAKFQQYKDDEYTNLEKSFVTYADLVGINFLNSTTDAEPFVTLPTFGHGLIGKYVKKYDIENIEKQNVIVRETVYRKLLNVDTVLKRRNADWQLVVVYGYRSRDIQQQLFNDEQEKIKIENPGLSENEITENVHRRIAVPSVAGHPTGGAVDVTIYDFENKCFLDFGTEVRDFSTRDVYFKSPFISKQQKDNRSLLRKIMCNEGFAPYDGEWWHFSYGDKEWAFYSRRQASRNKSDILSVDNYDKYLYAQKSSSELVYVDKYRDSAVVPQVGFIRLAIQKKGRLTEDTINILTKSGIDVAHDGGSFFGKCHNFPLEILFVRDDDIPSLVDAGAADIGIVGKNTYDELDCKSEIVKNLGFGRCALAIAIPEDSNIESIFDLSGKKVATSYPNSAKKFFDEANVSDVEVVPLSGSVEMAVTIGYADAIVDLVSTGGSLRQNKLKFLHKIFDSESVLVANKDVFSNKDKSTTINRLLIRINGYLSAKSYKRIMFSVSAEQLKFVNPILSQAKLLHAHDVLGGAEQNIVNAIIKKSSVWDIVEKLREIGATDIVLHDIESII